MRVRRRRRFLDDLSESYNAIAIDSPAAAEAFADEVEEVIALLADHPNVGRSRSELKAGLRSFPVRRFTHVLF